MKIEETLIFFLNLKTNSVEKPEIKIYDKYIGILLDLKSRDLTQTQIQSIESELETLNLNAESDNRKKYLSQKLSEFKKFLKDKLNLVSEGYYAGVGTGIGIVLGSIFSMLFNSALGTYSMLIGIIGGMLLGTVLGGIRDSKAKKQGRVLITELE
ncbi:hypothetical protein KO566_14010 [Flavobacteriaceae bacterium XHP0103]|uniref:hypothetical protein n=1 Tax=Marixanthotalea marina TaxID=2844359 RepID=UPI002989A6E3|nr:hypothetical protein [Marixanthotalea marina]MBU3823169.1 hypothetical protein [Marixanthotalea marina]